MGHTNGPERGSDAMVYDFSLYQDALEADIAYSAAITAATNGKRNRWTMRASDLTEAVQVAFARKVAADTVWLRHMRLGKDGQ